MLELKNWFKKKNIFTRIDQSMMYVSRFSLRDKVWFRWKNKNKQNKMSTKKNLNTWIIFRGNSFRNIYIYTSGNLIQEC